MISGDISKKQSPPQSYGHVWTDPALRLSRILETSASPSSALLDALSLGYFSQYTCYKDAVFVAQIVDWEATLLHSKYGEFLDFFPPDFEEKANVPAATKVSFKGRTVTPDLLRNVAYALQIRSLLFDRSLEMAPNRFLEIGSGSGSFARVYKALYPESQIWMADLPESLRFAEIYLRESFPSAHFLFAKEAADLQGDLSGVDFIFVPLKFKDAIAGHSFDLALNIWSFGEMPNHFIREWFEIIQSKCRISYFFTINAFLAPVTVDSVDRAKQGAWILHFDDRWKIWHFKINPDIHRNPFIKNFYCGLSIFAERLETESALQETFSVAKEGLTDTFLEDWVGVLLQEATDLGRPETKFVQSGENLPKIKDYFLNQLLATTEYIGRFNIDEGLSGTLFRLWNAYRVTKLTIAGELLVCYLAMISKTMLAQRCSKEELQILDVLTTTVIRSDYKAFLGRF